MKVLLVSTWNTPCGISEHSAMLKQAVEDADPGIEIDPCPGYLDPEQCLLTIDSVSEPGDIVHLNYHAALHSRWTPEQVARLGVTRRKIIVTYHDTIGEISPADLHATGDNRLDRLADLCPLINALVVHEPCEGLPIEESRCHYWRMGVPDWRLPYSFGVRDGHTPTARGLAFKRWRDQPVLGSIGFPFPWKNYDLLAAVTRKVGWALLLIAPGATREQLLHWEQLNPDLHVRSTFVQRDEAISLLSGCDATAFPYTGANTAQSAAICQGIAARKPVIATAHCRQFRALFDDRLGMTAIRWLESPNDLEDILSLFTSIGRIDPATVALAEQDSWEKLGKKYARLYREVAGE